MNTRLLKYLAVAGFATSPAYAQVTAYIPEPGEFVATASYQFQRYEDFWLGGGRFSLQTATGYETQHQHSTFITIEAGIARRVAADVTLGYTWAEFVDGPPGSDDLSDDGLTDTTVGLRYRLVDEREITWLPTITARVGAIIAGTYDETFPFSAGDGANGVEASLHFGQQICPNFGLYADVGYRWRENDVPDDIFGSAGVNLRWGGVTLSAGYRHIESVDGPDIGAPGFGTEFGFPQVREIQQNVEASLGYVDGGGRFYQVYYSRTIEGRNTGEKDILGLSVSIPFGGTGSHEAPLPPPGSYAKGK